MRAVVHDRYGPPDVLRLEQVERPVPEGGRGPRQGPRDDGQPDGLPHARARKPFVGRFRLGLRRPKQKILGMEFAGEVEAVGAAVTEFAVGDHVFGVGTGAHAEYVCVRESGALAHKPAGMTFEEAAAVCDGANHRAGVLRRAELREGQEHPRLRRVGIDRHRGRAARRSTSSRRDRGLQHEERRARALARRRRGGRLPAAGLHEERQDVDVIFDAVGKHSFRRCRAR